MVDALGSVISKRLKLSGAHTRGQGQRGVRKVKSSFTGDKMNKKQCVSFF